MLKAFVLVALICFIRPIDVPQNDELDLAVSWKNIECLLMSEEIRKTVVDIFSLVNQQEWADLIPFLFARYPAVKKEVLECMELKTEPTLALNYKYLQCIMIYPKYFCQKYLPQEPEENETEAEENEEENEENEEGNE